MAELLLVKWKRQLQVILLNISRKLNVLSLHTIGMLTCMLACMLTYQW